MFVFVILMILQSEEFYIFYLIFPTNLLLLAAAAHFAIMNGGKRTSVPLQARGAQRVPGS